MEADWVKEEEAKVIKSLRKFESILVLTLVVLVAIFIPLEVATADRAKQRRQILLDNFTKCVKDDNKIIPSGADSVNYCRTILGMPVQPRGKHQ